ncbi:MAG: hypothetical protein SFV21_12590 [Rhodospirillaceae bacterium]|nr:hypothetical protein [Rhodospirillaceae bacterium]
MIALAAALTGRRPEDMRFGPADRPGPLNGAACRNVAMFVAALHCPRADVCRVFAATPAQLDQARQLMGWFLGLPAAHAVEDLADRLHLACVRLKADRRRARAMRRLRRRWAADPAQPRWVFERWQPKRPRPLTPAERRAREGAEAAA